MNRAERRAAAAKHRRQAPPKDKPPALDRATLVRLAAAMVADDPKITGATLIKLSGEVAFLDAALRLGGAA
jgi:hypothetical protein